MARTTRTQLRNDWSVRHMAVFDDWDGIAQERTRNWDKAVRQRQLEQQIVRPRGVWKRRAGAWLIHAGGWLMRLGASMVGHESPNRVSVPG